jgi:hypothetical protein
VNEPRLPVQRNCAWILAILVTGVTSAGPGTARADEPSQAALVAARELFRQGAADADAGRFEVALEKFKRVAAIKETGPVRFNIAKCEHALGKLGAALNDYEIAEREAHEEKKTEIAKLAGQHAAALRPKVPRLTVAPPANPPKDLAVTLDGEKVPSGSLGVPLPVDPGQHRVEAAASGFAPFKKEVALKEREEQRVAVELVAEAPLAHPDDTPEMKLALEAPPPPPVAPTTPRRDHPEPETETSGSSRRTWGFITLGIGAALGFTSIVLWRVHESKVEQLNDAAKDAGCSAASGALSCPATTPSDVRTRLTSTKSSAESTGTASTVLAVGAGVALAAGLLLVLWPSKTPSTTSLAPMIGPETSGAGLHGTF